MPVVRESDSTHRREESLPESRAKVQSLSTPGNRGMTPGTAIALDKTQASTVVIDDSSTESEEEVSTKVKAKANKKQTDVTDLVEPDIHDMNSRGKEVLPYSLFDGRIDIPFLCPPKKYEPEQQPWMQ